MNCLLFVAHGSRSYRHAVESRRLAEEICDKLGAVCELAFMEKLHPTIGEALENLARFGCERVYVVPMFITLGSHAGRDIPEQIGGLKSGEPVVREVGGRALELVYVWPFIPMEKVVEAAVERLRTLFSQASTS